MYLLLYRKICNIIDFEIILNLLAGTQMQSELFLSWFMVIIGLAFILFISFYLHYLFFPLIL